jgi:hypothetical protein
MKPKNRPSSRGWRERVRNRVSTIDGERVLFESNLTYAPTVPMEEIVLEINCVSGSDTNSHFSNADKPWETMQNKLFGVRLLPQRARLRTLSINGKRPRGDSPARRMLAWKMREGALHGCLPASKVKKILSAPGIPVRCTGPLTESGGHGGMSPDAVAAAEIDKLWKALLNSQISPPKSDLPGHIRRLVTSCEHFASFLCNPNTDRIWGSLPHRRLANLRQEINDFRLAVRNQDLHLWNKGAKSLEKFLTGQRRSTLDRFIGNELRRAYERIYMRRCHIARPQGQPPTGPFIAFGLAFFEQVGFARLDSRGKRRPYPSAETVAGAVKVRRKPVT